VKANLPHVVKAVKHEVTYEHGRTLYKPIHTPPLSPLLNSNTTVVLWTMSQIPHLLSPYVALPPKASLTLLTSVLGASTNWLVLRYLQSYLGQNLESLSISSEPEDGESTKVLLVSFMRDFAFWKDGARKLVRFLLCFQQTPLLILESRALTSINCRQRRGSLLLMG
jgi:hypothetical protein